MDERDKKDKDEWEKQQRGAKTGKSRARKAGDTTQQFSQAERSPPPASSRPINRDKLLDRQYRLTSLWVWFLRAVYLVIIAGLFYGTWFIAIPAIHSYLETRYSANYRAPFYFCKLKNSDALYKQSDLFKDYYNFRRFEIRLYQHAAWELDGDLRVKYPDKAYLIEIPPMPKNYNTAHESYKSYQTYIHSDKAYRFYFDVSDNKTPIRIIEPDEARCDPSISSRSTPGKITAYIPYQTDEIGDCRTCGQSITR
jgi:hypothetical protein